MSYTLSLDPSLHNTGWARFDGSRLAGQGVITVPTKYKGLDAAHRMLRQLNFSLCHMSFDTIVAEVQLCRGQLKDRMKPQNMMDLHAVCVLCLYGSFPMQVIKRVPVYPCKVPKRIVHKRIREKYNLIETKGPQDYLDAINIGRQYIEAQ